MALMRGFTRVDKEGKIPIPKNMARETKLKPGQLVEIKTQGATPFQYLIIKPRKAAR